MTRILGIIADKDRTPWHMMTVALFINQRVLACNFAVFSNAFETSMRFFVHFLWRFFHAEQWQWGGCFRVLHPPGGSQRLGTWRGFHFVPRVRKKILRGLISAGSAGFSLSGHCRPRGITSGLRSLWMSKRSRHAGTKHWRLEGRPGQLRKSRMADEFDAFVLVISAGSRGWTTATPDDPFDFLCHLDTKKKVRRWCTKHLAPSWAGWATIRAGKGPYALDGTQPSPSEKFLSLS